MRAAPLVALTIVLTTMPLAAANAAPVPVAQVQTEAVLDEPVVFASLSFDPDGTIVSTSWEFADGRTRHGASVTYVLNFPGVHTITMRVVDDLGAAASLEVQVLVHQPLMHGRAYAVGAGGVTQADTGEVEETQNSETLATIGEARQGQLRVAGLDAQVNTHSNRAVARATVEHLYVPHPLGYFLVTGIESYTVVGCDYPTLLSARFTQVRLNDDPIVPPGEVAPNTAIPVPGGGLLELNVQEPVGDRISVVAVRHTAPDGTVTEIARADAGVTHCPYA